MNDPHGNSPLLNGHSSPTEICTRAVLTCTALWWRTPYVSNSLSIQAGKFQSAFYTRSTTLDDPHGNSPLRNKHSAPYGVFVHELNGPVQHYGGDELLVSQAKYTSWEVP